MEVGIRSCSNIRPRPPMASPESKPFSDYASGLYWMVFRNIATIYCYNLKKKPVNSNLFLCLARKSNIPNIKSIECRVPLLHFRIIRSAQICLFLGEWIGDAVSFWNQIIRRFEPLVCRQLPNIIHVVHIIDVRALRPILRFHIRYSEILGSFLGE